MPDFTTVGRYVMLAGLIVVAVGGVLWLVGRFGLPVGRLPGDLVIQREGFTLYIPLATSILLSIVLTILLAVLGRFLRR